MNISKSMFNTALLKFGDFASKQHVVRLFEFYEECQWWPRDRLIEYQNIKLKKLINVSITDVPFYKELYKSVGFKCGDNFSVHNLHELPLVTKADLKANYPSNCTRKTNLPVKEYFTSGSSGNPFAVLVDNFTMSQARALMLLRAYYAGWTIGEPVFQTGMSLNRGVVKKLKDILFNIYYASAYDLSDNNLDKYLDVIDKKRIKFLMGYPGSILALADRAGQVGFNQKMDGIATWGDNLYAHYRKKIEQQFTCKVTDTYGCGEGIQVAAQCPDGYDHYHIFMPHVIVEIVDDDGQPVKRGDSGHILLTRLEPGAMPLIRYYVGDVGRMASLDICKCGRGFDLLEKIEGRDSDFIHTPNGNRLIVHFFTGIFEYYPEINQFCVYQTALDEIQILVVPRKKLEQTTLDKIKNEILDKGDSDLHICFELVDKIEQHKNGKRKFVISTIKP